MRKVLSHRVARFVLVGFANASISFGLLNLMYYQFNQSKIVSSIISTSCALLFSFVMNRGFVFGDKTRPPLQQLPAFIAVTISGSLIVINIVYVLFLGLIDGHEQLIINPLKSVTGIELSKSFVDINLSTVAGALVAMFWNYNGYKWFVFKGSKRDAIEEAIEHTP